MLRMNTKIAPRVAFSDFAKIPVKKPRKEANFGKVLYASCDRSLALRGEKMKTKKLAVISLLVLLATMTTVVYIAPVQAQDESHWITSYTVTDTQTGEKLIEADFTISDEPTVFTPVISGEELTVTFTVNIALGGTGNLKLATYMQKPTSGTYWELVPGGDYDLGAGYSPNSASWLFGWEKGTFDMICYGQATKVTKATNVTLVQLSGETGDIIDAIKVTVLTAGAGDFQNLYDQKEAKLESLIASGVAAGYTTMFSNMLNQSKALVSKGYVNEAIALLNAIPSSGEPLGSAMEMILLPAVIAAAVAAAFFALMFLRSRGKVSYFRLVVEDQIKDLEGLTLRASKIDRTMSASLDSVKDRLKRLVGM